MDQNDLHFAVMDRDLFGKLRYTKFRTDADVAVWVSVRRMLADGVPLQISDNGIPLSPGVDGVILPKYFVSATWSSGGAATPGGSAEAPDQVNLWTSQGHPQKPDIWSSVDHTTNVFNTNPLAKEALERQIAAAHHGGGRRRRNSPRRRVGSRTAGEKSTQTADDEIISLADSAEDGPAGAGASPEQLCASGRPWRQKGLNQAGNQKKKRRGERAALAASAKRRAQGRTSPSPPPISTHPNTVRSVGQTRRRSPSRSSSLARWAAEAKGKSDRPPKRSAKRDRRSVEPATEADVDAEVAATAKASKSSQQGTRRRPAPIGAPVELDEALARMLAPHQHAQRQRTGGRGRGKGSKGKSKSKTTEAAVGQQRQDTRGSRCKGGKDTTDGRKRKRK